MKQGIIHSLLRKESTDYGTYQSRVHSQYRAPVFRTG